MLALALALIPALVLGPAAPGAAAVPRGRSSGEALRPGALFLCRDAGETLAFLPVLQLMNGNRSHATPADAPRAVALATTLNAAQHLSSLPAATVLTWERLGLPGVTSQQFLDRNATLRPDSLHALLSQLRPRVVVSGLVSSIQYQLASAWTSASAPVRVIGYDDGFGLSVSTRSSRSYPVRCTGTELSKPSSCSPSADPILLARVDP